MGGDCDGDGDGDGDGDDDCDGDGDGDCDGDGDGVTNGDIITITIKVTITITITVTSHPGRDLSSASWVPASPSNLYHSSWTNRINKTQKHNKHWMSLPRL